MLNNGLLDFVISNEDDKNHDNLLITKIKEIDHCFISKEDLSNKNMDLKDLNSYPLILQKKESNTRQYLDSFALENKIIFKPTLEVVSQELVIEFTKIGLGIGFIIKDLIIDELKNKELYEINLKEKLDKKSIWLVTNKNTIPTYASKKFIKYITN